MAGLAAGHFLEGRWGTPVDPRGCGEGDSAPVELEVVHAHVGRSVEGAVADLALLARRRVGAEVAAAGRRVAAEVLGAAARGLPAQRVVRRLIAALLEGRGAGDADGADGERSGGQEGDDRLHVKSPVC